MSLDGPPIGSLWLPRPGEIDCLHTTYLFRLSIWQESEYEVEWSDWGSSTVVIRCLQNGERQQVSWLWLVSHMDQVLDRFEDPDL